MDGCVVVESVLEGSPAHAAGICKDDAVVSVDGSAVAGLR